VQTRGGRQQSGADGGGFREERIGRRSSYQGCRSGFGYKECEARRSSHSRASFLSHPSFPL